MIHGSCVGLHMLAYCHQSKLFFLQISKEKLFIVCKTAKNKTLSKAIFKNSPGFNFVICYKNKIMPQWQLNKLLLLRALHFGFERFNNR
jgi:hypothetical protein